MLVLLDSFVILPKEYPAKYILRKGKGNFDPLDFRKLTPVDKNWPTERGLYITHYEGDRNKLQMDVMTEVRSAFLAAPVRRRGPSHPWIRIPLMVVTISDANFDSDATESHSKPTTVPNPPKKTVIKLYYRPVMRAARIRLGHRPV
ncbi:hypothetical protein MCOR25_001304 [Pyricularia grisea]|nr:hypothetical protein MCOR25_001304 [Pyricularia grisea]